MPAFDQRAFVHVVGVVEAAIAQASIAGSQGDSNKTQRFRTHLPSTQRFRTHLPSTFTGGRDPMVVDHWFMQIEKVLEAMEITSDASRIRLAAF